MFASIGSRFFALLLLVSGGLWCQAVEASPIQQLFRLCLSSTKAVMSYPTNETWWYDSQGIHVPVLKHPMAVAFAVSTSQVVKLIECAIKFHVKPVPRSGGHCYEAFSSEDDNLVIDISRMNTVRIDRPSRTANVGAGTRLGKLYYELSKNQLLFPAGDCTTVGLGGHVLAGGFGYVMRQYGLATDNVLEMQFVDWRGRSFIVNERNEHKDLFWALCGGGSGNFGIVTRMILKLHPYPELTTGFQVSWNAPVDTSQLGRMLFKWKPWSSVPSVMTFAILLEGDSPRLSGFYLGSDGLSGVEEILNGSGLMNIAGGTKLKHLSSKNYFQVQVWFANNLQLPNGDRRDYQPFNTPPFVLKPLDLLPFPNPVYEAWIPIQNDSRVNSTPPADDVRNLVPITGLKPARIGHVYDKYSSQMFVREFDDAAYVAINKYLERGGLTQWKPNGGFMSNISEDHIAFPHRNVLFDAQHFSLYNVPGEDMPRSLRDKLELYQSLVMALEPFTDHTSYHGYPDLLWSTDPEKYLRRYFAGNVKRLIQVKRMYDPHNFFSNKQSVPPYI